MQQWITGWESNQQPLQEASVPGPHAEPSDLSGGPFIFIFFPTELSFRSFLLGWGIFGDT